MKRIGICVEWDRSWGRNICEGICAFAKTQPDWSLALCKPTDFKKSAASADFDGFITHMPDSILESLLASTHGVVVDLACRTRYDARAVRGIWQDNAAIGRLAARHFIEHRFTRFAFCGYDGQAFSDLRRDAFKRTLEHHQHSVEAYTCPASATRAFASYAVRGERLSSAPDSRQLVRWLKSLPKPIALFCANDLRGLQVIMVCGNAKIAVPQEVAVLGVDNDTLICNFVTPTISSIDPNATTLGFIAAESLCIALEGSPCLTEERIVKPRELITRASTNIFPLDPPWLSDALIYIQRNISRHLSAQDVYAALGRSHTTVNAAFREKLGGSVQAEIRRVALEEARRLLERTDFSVATVAKRTGFHTPQYFCNVFTSVFGRSPSAFRQKPRN